MLKVIHLLFIYRANSFFQKLIYEPNDHDKKIKF